MLNIFEGDIIYGTKYEQCAPARPFNAQEKAHLNMSVPGVVFMGTYNLSCKLFAHGSTTQYYCKSIDTNSPVSEGQMFDLNKCMVTQWKRPDAAEVKVKIYVPAEAIL